MSVGIVVPCFNEAGRWNQDYWRAMIEHVPARFLFVDDGSTDATATLLQQLVGASGAEMIRLPCNSGKAEAVRQGMNHLLRDGTHSGVGYLDADGAFHQDDVSVLIQTFDAKTTYHNFDAVWSSRVALAGRDIKRSQTRHYLGRVIATYLSISETSFPYDTQSGYKMFVNSDTLRASLSSPFTTRWLFEIELLARWRQAYGSSMRIWEQPLDYWHDVPGSKINRAESLRILQELWKVKVEQRRRKP